MTDATSSMQTALEQALSTDACLDPGGLLAGMRYAVLQGGKRLRPLVVLAACEAVGGSLEQALPACCAIEFIHAYSLVHDDLPAMDNDLERRGQPTVHVAFGEAQAILIGDALLTQAFQLLSRAETSSAEARIQAISVLAHHAGLSGMIGGQALDLSHGQNIGDLQLLEQVHQHKTGALFAASGALGAIFGGGTPEQVVNLERWGLCFGIAFQHTDDVLDHEQSSMRSQASQRISQLSNECLAIAQRFSNQGTSLHKLTHWLRTRLDS